jgi:hypothetical protein
VGSTSAFVRGQLSVFRERMPAVVERQVVLRGSWIEKTGKPLRKLRTPHRPVTAG